MSQAQRGEIWLIDLGMTSKTRPVLIMSIGYDDWERAIISFVPRTTSVRGTRHEVPHHARGFDDGAFDAQGVAGAPAARLVRRLGVVDGPTLVRVENALRSWLGLT